jgi:hypothetical protein
MHEGISGTPKGSWHRGVELGVGDVGTRIKYAQIRPEVISEKVSE